MSATDKTSDLLERLRQCRDMLGHVIRTADDPEYENDADFVSALDWGKIRDAYNRARETK